jgi:hypothetical protein
VLLMQSAKNPKPSAFGWSRSGMSRSRTSPAASRKAKPQSAYTTRLSCKSPIACWTSLLTLATAGMKEE